MRAFDQSWRGSVARASPTFPLCTLGGMKLEQRISAAFRMTDETWARHANPWSVWTRFTAFPALILAVWSRAWLGRWAAVPIFGAVLWTWLNPRLFERPRSTDNWASKAVLGERVWMNRDAVPIPPGTGPAPTC